VPNFGIHDHRRYSAVLFHHPQVTTFQDLKAALPRSVGKTSELKGFSSSNWNVQRFEYLFSRSLYPAHLLNPETRKRRNGYAHDVYFAIQTRRGAKHTNNVMIASPYVRLLEAMFGELRRALPAPSLLFSSVNMPLVFENFIRGEVEMTAVKVTLQMLNEKTLSLVSLSGRNPLRSDLHRAISDVAAPYSLRSSIEDGSSPSRVEVDRHGNIWWYQIDESRIRGALSLIDAMDGWSSLIPARTNPLDRLLDQ
jgi:hypothetical protein